MSYERPNPPHEQSPYEHLLHISKLVIAAEMLADSCPNMHLTGAPPIHYLLEQAVIEIDHLASRLSD